jgi:HK97 gp10 family phage protein
MSVKVSVTGIKEIDNVLKGLPKQVQHRVLVSAHKFAAQPFVQAAKALAPKREGKMAASIQAVSMPFRRATESGMVLAGPSKKKGTRGYVARFIEKGTVQRKLKGGKKYPAGTNRGKIVAKPFLEPAFNQTKKAVEDRIAEGIGRRLASFMKRTIKKANG